MVGGTVAPHPGHLRDPCEDSGSAAGMVGKAWKGLCQVLCLAEQGGGAASGSQAHGWPVLPVARRRESLAPPAEEGRRGLRAGGLVLCCWLLCVTWTPDSPHLDLHCGNGGFLPPGTEPHARGHLWQASPPRGSHGPSVCSTGQCCVPPAAVPSPTGGHTSSPPHGYSMAGPFRYLSHAAVDICHIFLSPSSSLSLRARG